MKATKARTILALALCATGFLGSVQAKDTRVFWLIDGQQTAIHRFNVTNVGEAGETWTETEPLCRFGSNKQGDPLRQERHVGQKRGAAQRLHEF